MKCYLTILLLFFISISIYASSSRNYMHKDGELNAEIDNIYYIQNNLGTNNIKDDAITGDKIDDNADVTVDDLTVNYGVFCGTLMVTEGVHVDRGDPAAADFGTGDFTIDGAYHDLDLSGIIPSTAKSVVLLVYAKDDVISDAGGVYFRKNGNTNSAVVPWVNPQVADITIRAQLIVACDTSQKIEYLVTTSLTALNVTITGYFN